MNKRFYLVNVEETEIDVIGCSDKQFKEESLKQGNFYESEDAFSEDFNKEIFSTATHQLRILK